MRYFLLLLLAFLLSPRLAAASTLEDGRSAMEREEYKLAFEILEPLAEQGDAEAEYLVGMLYRDGKGTKQDYRIGNRWIRAAAERGNKLAQASIGSGIANSDNKDIYVKGYMWLALSDLGGDVHSNGMLTYLAQKMSPEQIAEAKHLVSQWTPTPAPGSIVKNSPLQEGLIAHRKRDYQTAVKLLQPLADEGYELAQQKMGDMYATGNGVPKDRKEALKWYIKAKENHSEMVIAEKAAAKGDPDAEYALGTFYRCLPDQIGYCEMKKWLQQATEHGNWRAQDDLWDYELSGKERLYVPKDELLNCHVSGASVSAAPKRMKSPARAPEWATNGPACMKY